MTNSSKQFIDNLPATLKTKFYRLTTDRQQTILTRLMKRKLNIHFVFEDISDPHNLMAATRSIDAFGFQYIHIIFNQQQGFNPRKVGKKTSASANKWLTFCIYHSLHEALNTLKDKGLTLVATTLTPDAVPITDFVSKVTPENGYAILFGNEHQGLSNDIIQASDIKVTIPMTGFVESLNLSVSVSIFAWELYKKLINSKSDPTDIDQERLQILQKWLDK